MQALVTQPGTAGTAHIADVAEPAAADGAVLLRVVEVGVCGTDREIIDGHFGVAPPGRDTLVLGHELLGRVERDGHGFSRGDLVAATVRRSCGHCAACAAGSPDSCLTGDYTERGITALDGFASELVAERAGAPGAGAGAAQSIGVLSEPTSVGRARRAPRAGGGRSPGVASVPRAGARQRGDRHALGGAAAARGPRGLGHRAPAGRQRGGGARRGARRALRAGGRGHGRGAGRRRRRLRPGARGDGRRAGDGVVGGPAGAQRRGGAARHRRPRPRRVGRRPRARHRLHPRQPRADRQRQRARRRLARRRRRPGRRVGPLRRRGGALRRPARPGRPLRGRARVPRHQGGAGFG